MQVELAADPAVRTDRAGDGLFRFVPRAGFAHLVFGGEHQRAGGTDPDAVPAVDARALVEAHRILRRDAGVEPAPGHRDRERVLRVDAAGLHALVTEDAPRVVAHVELVVDLDGLGHAFGHHWVDGVV